MRIKKRDKRNRLVGTSKHRFDLYFDETDNREIVDYLNSLTKRDRLQKEMEVLLRIYMAGGRTFLQPTIVTPQPEYSYQPDRDILDDFGTPA